MLRRLRRFAKFIGRDAAILWFVCRNPATPTAIKAAAIALALYVISPVDLIPDWMPVMGWLDDIGLVTLALGTLLRMVPQPLLDQANMAAQRRLSKWSFWRQ